MTELEYLFVRHDLLQKERRELTARSDRDGQHQRWLEQELRRVNEQLMELQNLK